MGLSAYILLAAGTLFVMVDPLATVPAFLAMTPNDTQEQRVRTAWQSYSPRAAAGFRRLSSPAVE